MLWDQTRHQLIQIEVPFSVVGRRIKNGHGTLVVVTVLRRRSWYRRRPLLLRVLPAGGVICGAPVKHAVNFHSFGWA